MHLYPLLSFFLHSPSHLVHTLFLTKKTSSPLPTPPSSPQGFFCLPSYFISLQSSFIVFLLCPSSLIFFFFFLSSFSFPPPTNHLSASFCIARQVSYPSIHNAYLLTQYRWTDTSPRATTP